MPNFDFNVDEYISVDDFLSECSSSEIEELIEALIEDGHLPKHSKTDIDARGVGESIYEESLNKLHGKWNRLSQEEEETIINIAKRF